MKFQVSWVCLDDDVMEVLKYKHLRDGTSSVSDELALAREAAVSGDEISVGGQCRLGRSRSAEGRVPNSQWKDGRPFATFLACFMDDRSASTKRSSRMTAWIL